MKAATLTRHEYHDKVSYRVQLPDGRIVWCGWWREQKPLPRPVFGRRYRHQVKLYARLESSATTYRVELRGNVKRGPGERWMLRWAVSHLPAPRVPVVACPACEGDGSITDGCSTCSGSGEGMADGTNCRDCRGRGDRPPRECDDCKGSGKASCLICGDPATIDADGRTYCTTDCEAEDA